MNRELPDVEVGFRKGRGTRDQTTNICWITEKAIEFQKNIYFCLIDYAKAFGCVDPHSLFPQQTVGEKKKKKDGTTRAPDLPPDKSVCRSRNNH